MRDPAHLSPRTAALQYYSDRSVSASAPPAAGRNSPVCCWGTAGERNVTAGSPQAHLKTQARTQTGSLSRRWLGNWLLMCADCTCQCWALAGMKSWCHNKLIQNPFSLHLWESSPHYRLSRLKIIAACGKVTLLKHGAPWRSVNGPWQVKKNKKTG